MVTGKEIFAEGRVYSMTDMVDYGAEAVVSRALIQKPSGNVTLFALDENQSISEHTAPYDALVYLMEGSLVITISGTPHDLKQGDTIIMPAGRPHSLSAAEKTKMLLVMIRE